MRCLVIDDERIAREGLLEFTKQFDFLQAVGDYANALESLDLIRNKEVDLIFLDIEMPGMKGIRFAELISDLPVMVIFTTAYAEHALKGYQVNAIGYLLKPIFFEDFEKAVLKAKKWHELRHVESGEVEYLFFKENGVSHRVVIEDIVYVKSLQNYVQLFLKDKRVIIVHTTLKAVQDLLPTNKFIQLHRSYLAQKACITSIDGHVAHVQFAALPIARDRKQLLVELLTQRETGGY